MHQRVGVNGERDIGLPAEAERKADVKHGPLVKWPKTPASHAGNRGSNPLRVTKREGIFTGKAVIIYMQGMRQSLMQNSWCQ